MTAAVVMVCAGVACGLLGVWLLLWVASGALVASAGVLVTVGVSATATGLFMRVEPKPPHR